MKSEQRFMPYGGDDWGWVTDLATGEKVRENLSSVEEAIKIAKALENEKPA